MHPSAAPKPLAFTVGTPRERERPQAGTAAGNDDEELPLDEAERNAAWLRSTLGVETG